MKQHVISFDSNNKDQITKNFKVNEFACSCYSCNKSFISLRLVQILQGIREHFKKSIKVTSAYRCHLHNNYVGGVPKSQHVRGYAADIVVQGILPDVIQEYLIMNQDKLKVTIGRYDKFTHVDVREKPIVFDKRKG